MDQNSPAMNERRTEIFGKLTVTTGDVFGLQEPRLNPFPPETAATGSTSVQICKSPAATGSVIHSIPKFFIFSATSTRSELVSIPLIRSDRSSAARSPARRFVEFRFLEMESILARALEYTLKYWVKSFSRDQVKLQGRTMQISNLDMNEDALHASLGLPLALNVATARVGKVEIMVFTSKSGGSWCSNPILEVLGVLCLLN